MKIRFKDGRTGRIGALAEVLESPGVYVVPEGQEAFAEACIAEGIAEKFEIPVAPTPTKRTRASAEE